MRFEWESLTSRSIGEALGAPGRPLVVDAPEQMGSGIWDERSCSGINPDRPRQASR